MQACARFLSGLKNASFTVLIATHHKHVKFQAHAGLRRHRKRKIYLCANTVYREDVVDFIRKLWTPSTKHVSLTGGEPLLHADFIKTLDMEYPLYLETNSGFPEKARELKDIIAIASCDIKLPEHDCTDHYSQLLKNELETISILNETAKTFVKVIIMPETTKQSLSFAIEGVKSIDDKYSFYPSACDIR